MVLKNKLERIASLQFDEQENILVEGSHKANLKGDANREGEIAPAEGF